MNKMTKKIIPDLRFPEFLNDGGWEEKLLGDVCFITNGKSNAQDHIENGIYPLFDRSAIIKASNEYIFDTEAVIIPGEGMRFIPKYFIGKFDLHQRAYALKDFTCIGNFVYYSMNHRSKLISEKAVQSTVLSLRLPILQNFPIQLPKAKDEQQKIASCLSSLDQLITAQKEKLELLKNHKKGLMQNLFPQEGETVPKFRFPEFENDGKWDGKKLGTIGNPSMCKRIFKEETSPNGKNKIPFYKIGTFGKEPDAFISKELYEEYKSKFSFPKKGEILISASGTIGRLVVYDGEPAFFQDSNIVWISNKEENVLNKFLYYIYSLLTWQTSDGGIIKRLYNADLKNMDITFPENKIEQNKIASCLSSLDSIISSQTDKIEKLQFHKKGLMQGLFPKMID